MNTNILNVQELNSIVSTLKKKEIYYHRLKIINLSQTIFLHPEQINLTYNLQESLKRLEYLLSA